MAKQTKQIGKVSITPKGIYQGGVEYEYIDVVVFEGESYLSKIPNNTLPLTDITAWLKITEKGEQGVTPIKGVDYFTEQDKIEISESIIAELDLSNYATIDSIPTNTSDLVNDSGYLINTVNDLINYYNKTEVDGLISSLSSVSFEKVDTLPATGESNVIYLLPNGDVFDEYIWVDSKWEMIGTTRVDLSDYYTKTEIDTLLEIINTELSTKLTKTQADGFYVGLDGYIEFTQVEKDKLAEIEEGSEANIIEGAVVGDVPVDVIDKVLQFPEYPDISVKVDKVEGLGLTNIIAEDVVPPVEVPDVIFATEQYVDEALATKADSDNVVNTNNEQSLSTEQKLQSQENIGILVMTQDEYDLLSEDVVKGLIVFIKSGVKIVKAYIHGLEMEQSAMRSFTSGFSKGFEIGNQ